MTINAHRMSVRMKNKIILQKRYFRASARGHLSEILYRPRHNTQGKRYESDYFMRYIFRIVIFLGYLGIADKEEILPLARIARLYRLRETGEISLDASLSLNGHYF